MDTSINIIPSIDFVNKKRRGEELAIGPARAFFLPKSLLVTLLKMRVSIQYSYGAYQSQVRFF